MNTKLFRSTKLAAALAVGFILAMNCFAGAPQKWDDLPEAVRAAVLANGGKAGQQVDKENGSKNGLAIYEASVKDKDGTTADLVITADGKLAETKHDDAADRAAEIAAENAKKKSGPPKFTHPRDITNPFLPFVSLKQDILEGTEDGKKVHIERTAKPDVKKTFKIGGQTVESFAVEDKELEDGVLAEIALDYFAQDDDGTVYYLGEDVDEYADGKIVGHAGSWLLGKDTKKPGIILPDHPKVGDKFMSEDVNKEISESDEVISLTEDCIVPAGNFQNCVKVVEHLGDGTTEYKYYAEDVGAVREIPAVGDVRLISHTAK